MQHDWIQLHSFESVMWDAVHTCYGCGARLALSVVVPTLSSRAFAAPAGISSNGRAKTAARTGALRLDPKTNMTQAVHALHVIHQQMPFSHTRTCKPYNPYDKLCDESCPGIMCASIKYGIDAHAG